MCIRHGYIVCGKKYIVLRTYIAYTYCRDGVPCLVGSWSILILRTLAASTTTYMCIQHTPSSSRRINGASTSTLHFQKLGPKGGNGNSHAIRTINKKKVRSPKSGYAAQSWLWIDDQQTGEHAGLRCHCPETWVHGSFPLQPTQGTKKKKNQGYRSNQLSHFDLTSCRPYTAYSIQAIVNVRIWSDSPDFCPISNSAG